MAEIGDVLRILEFELPEGKELADIDISDIQKIHNEKFIGKNIAHEDQTIKGKVLGKEWGSYETAFKRLAREVELEGVEITGKKDDVDKITEVLKTKIDSIKENSTASKDKQVEQLTNDLNKYKADYNTVLKQKEEADNLVLQKDNEFKSYKTNLTLNQKIDQAKNGISFSEQVNDYTKKGFFVELSEKYNIELSEENDSDDGLRISDKNGNRIQNGSKFTTLKELYEKEAKDAKILKLSDSKPDKKVVVQSEVVVDNAKKVNPQAEAFAQELQNQSRGL